MGSILVRRAWVWMPEQRAVSAADSARCDASALIRGPGGIGSGEFATYAVSANRLLLVLTPVPRPSRADLERPFCRTFGVIARDGAARLHWLVPDWRRLPGAGGQPGGQPRGVEQWRPIACRCPAIRNPRFGSARFLVPSGLGLGAAEAAPQNRGGKRQRCFICGVSVDGHTGLESCERASSCCQQQHSAGGAGCWQPARRRQARAACKHLPRLIEAHHVHRTWHAEAVNAAGRAEEQALIRAQRCAAEWAVTLPERRDHAHLARQQHAIVNPNRQHDDPRA
jgi:hypothetical protein